MLNERIESSKSADDVSIDVLGLSRSRQVKVEMKEDADATENSSSFADTISGNENTSGLSDVEVESQFFGDTDLAPPFDGFGSVFPIRKKKLSAHWRNFIHPIMWRCKWTELRIKELESQASKYARELTVNVRRKHTAGQMAVEQSGSKSLPFTHRSHRKRPMKRRRRKRVEDTTDIASYMSKHILFAERENKKPDQDGVPPWENLGSSDQHTTGRDEFGNNDDYPFPEDEDNFLLENILRKIELVHSRVHKLKGQLDSIMIKNAGKFSSSENLSQLVAQMSPTLSACNGETVSLGDFIGEIGDFIMPDSAVSSFGEAIAIPDIIESTVGLLSSIDVTHHQPQVGDSSEKIVDNILIQNEATEVEGSAFRYSHNEKILEAEQSGEEESNKAAVPLASEPDTLANTVSNPILQSCLSSDIHFPTNKRKRGERKAGSANWSRQKPGETDG